MLAKGIAIDKFTKEPLTRANVIITDEQGNVIENSKKTTSDDDGVFSIEVLPADYIAISYIGYVNKIVPISQFSSDIKTIPMTYLKSKDGNSGYFKERDTDNDGALTNRPISMWYWLEFGIIGYYIYKQVKK
jgi:hypothetical protein